MICINVVYDFIEYMHMTLQEPWKNPSTANKLLQYKNAINLKRRKGSCSKNLISTMQRIKSF